MATLSVIHPSLIDINSRLDPDGKIAKIIEVAAPVSQIFEDMIWKEGNLASGEKTTIRTGYSTPTWRKLYGGVQPTKSTTAQVTDTCGMLEDYSEIDVALADLQNNAAEFRASEDVAKVQSLMNEFTSTLFYGDEDLASEEFTGFAPRFNDQSAANGDNILTDAATPDSTDNSSIWLIGWGLNTVHGIVPKGSVAGWKISDKGQVTAENIDGNNGRAEIYRTHYRWDCGLCIKDWRYVVRINYDLENIVASGATGPVLSDLMGKALRRIPSLSMCRPVFYASRATLDALDLQSSNKGTLAFTNIEDAQGKLITRFRGVPVKRVDALLNTESGV